MKNIITTCFAILLSTIFADSLFAKNSILLEPKPGTISTGTACTVSVQSDTAIDSVGISVEYHSSKGEILRKHIATITTAPYKIVIPTNTFSNQYFFGATIRATSYRSDGTTQTGTSSRVFFLPEPIIPQKLPFYPSGNSKPVPFGQHSITVSHDPHNVNILFSIPAPDSIKESNIKPIMLIIDPQLSRTPFPGSGVVILSVPVTGESKLVNLSKQNSESLNTSSNEGTPINLKKRFSIQNGIFSGEISIPDVLLGGKVRDTLGLNLIFPYSDGDSFPISFVSGDTFSQYCPILFPLFISANLPTENSSFPFKIFIGGFLVGLTLALILVITRKVQKLTSRSINEPESDLIVLIEEHITNPKLSAQFLAAKLGCSIRSVNREIKMITGMNMVHYLESLRIEIVKERLVSSNANEILIAQECGFKNVGEMEELFHSSTGVASYQYRNYHHQIK